MVLPNQDELMANYESSMGGFWRFDDGQQSVPRAVAAGFFLRFNSIVSWIEDMVPDAMCFSVALRVGQ
jgi:hypothetical protein